MGTHGRLCPAQSVGFAASLEAEAGLVQRAGKAESPQVPQRATLPLATGNLTELLEPICTGFLLSPKALSTQTSSAVSSTGHLRHFVLVPVSRVALQQTHVWLMST